MRNVYHAPEAEDGTGGIFHGLAALARHALDGEGYEKRAHLGGLRACWYCGSISPEDLVKAFRDGRVTEWSGSDWKYGWPHKFYITIDSGKPAVPYYYVTDHEAMEAWRAAGSPSSGWDSTKRFVTKEEFAASKSGGGTGNEDGTGPIWTKFYTGHLEDALGDPIFDELAEIFQKRLGITFKAAPEGAKRGIMYSSPSHGYQTWGGTGEVTPGAPEIPQ